MKLMDLRAHGDFKDQSNDISRPDAPEMASLPGNQR